MARDTFAPTHPEASPVHRLLPALLLAAASTTALAADTLLSAARMLDVKTGNFIADPVLLLMAVSPRWVLRPNHPPRRRMRSRSAWTA
jgi:hypothetical protein